MNKNHNTLTQLLSLLMAATIVLAIFAGCSKPADPDNIGGNNTGENSGEQNVPVTVKNVIFMIADGGGYDNFTLADKVKEEMTRRSANKLAGAKTEVTTDLLAGLGKATTDGLYLNEFLVGSANTLLLTPHGNANHPDSYITDSAAAGTALSSGYKTNYCYVGIDSDKNPRASLTELARIKGMSTGLVTTKSYVDATPLAFFTAHSIHRYEYQDNSLQALLSGMDVVIGEGTEHGDRIGALSSHPDICASSMGYTVARNKTNLLAQANNQQVKKLWAPILGLDNSSKQLKTKDRDLASSLISYDVDAALSAEQPSLLEMTQAALQVLGSNINDPDGFFLMIEGGALDNAAENGYLRAAVGEYLAFDEAFGYCVNWAAQRGDTVVIAVPDHDSGGFSGIEKCEEELIDGIITGKLGSKDFTSKLAFDTIVSILDNMGADSEEMKLKKGHTDMAVPICLYAPDSVRNDLLQNMGLPTAVGDVRLGNKEYYVENAGDSFTWYTSSALNNDYTIENSAIAPAIAKTLNMGSLDDATKLLFSKVSVVDADGNCTGEYGGEVVFSKKDNENDYAIYTPCAYENTDKGLVLDRNSATYQLNSEKRTYPVIGNQPLRSIFVLEERLDSEVGIFYVPQALLDALK